MCPNIVQDAPIWQEDAIGINWNDVERDRRNESKPVKTDRQWSIWVFFLSLMLFLPLSEWPVLQLGIGNLKRLHPDPTFDGGLSLIRLNIDWQLQHGWKSGFAQWESITISEATDLRPLPLRVHWHRAYFGNYFFYYQIQIMRNGTTMGHYLFSIIPGWTSEWRWIL